MMPNPFTPPPEGAPEHVMVAWRALLAAWQKEQSAFDALTNAQKDLAFARRETDTAWQVYDRERPDDARQTA